jgi:hypothetical protein
MLVRLRSGFPAGFPNDDVEARLQERFWYLLRHSPNNAQVLCV